MQELVTECLVKDACSPEMADKPLVVGVFIQHYPPQLGGAECQAKILVTELAGLGCRVELVTTRHRSDLCPDINGAAYYPTCAHGVAQMAETALQSGFGICCGLAGCKKS